MQELLEYADVAMAMIYTHVVRMGGRAVHSLPTSLPGADGLRVGHL
jgi:site-specific recombinase XerD